MTSDVQLLYQTLYKGQGTAEGTRRVGLQIIFTHYSTSIRRMRWRNWLRHCATSRKVVGYIPDGVTGIFSDIILGLTQPLTEMSTRNNSWGVKADSAWG
jgi:hypothetical protein